ncbi:VCBS repeat-containing protein [Dyadobacter sp. CY312]|uniref:FG-GAP repeat domain-containing protein n=1 Tax=Dyadobacter sp. CY312 TaxID=2907303 RepID=UPI001F360726|nr:VCBS repeat-containing protein [Dyadobacter sp. CY312]MCE7042597.1 FG-GAP-like repeat-containing protein [Dyadobacter sp. CY312]
MNSCSSGTKKEGLADDLSHPGAQLSARHCGSCHLAVSPALLDKETWKKRVLPAMARQLGLEVWQNSAYYQNEKSAISYADWMMIVAYYDSLAPAHLATAKSDVPLKSDFSIFKLRKPQAPSDRIATTTLAAIDPITLSIYTSDSETGNLYHWNNDLKLISSNPLPSPAVNMDFINKQQALVTCIGEMKALDIPSGNVMLVDESGKSTSTIASNLIRPIQTVAADFDKDGLTDYVTSSFGHNKGGLFLMKQKADKSFKTLPIREVAGATQSITGDFNADGWMDIMTLFAHGDEGIWLFTNNKKGGFDQKNILRFPPVYGSSSFQMADVNKDGNPDIIYTAGDNSDYSRILKPYHGIYIFTNSGNMSFKQSYFYPVNGATKVIAADFDLDGDIDLASIAFFADLKNNPAEGFIYFENKNSSQNKTLSFTPHAAPVNQNGRWICMDVNDVDGDGDIDIVLGNYSKGFLNEDHFTPNWNTATPFVILENTIK